MKVPVTVVLADLTADSRSKAITELEEASCSCCDEVYEFHSDSKEEEEEEVAAAAADFC